MPREVGSGPSASFVAIGTPVGIVPSADDRPSAVTIRAGSRFVALDGSSARVWVRAAAPAGSAELAADARSDGDLEELVSTGLLVQLPVQNGADTIEESFFGLVPVPLTRIATSGLNDDGSWSISDWNGQPRVQLDQIDYLVWSFLNGRVSIREALHRTASILEVEPARLRDRAIRLIVALLISRSIVLDEP